MALTPKQVQAIAALLSCRTIEEAAEAVGIGTTTMRRWLKDDLFQAELRAAEGEAIDAATRQLVSLTGTALSVLQCVLDDPQATYTLKIRAAVAVLDNLLKLRELRNLEERLSALERQIHGQAKYG